MLKDFESFLPNQDPKSLEKFPFFWISQVNGKYAQLIDKSLKKIGLDNTKRKIILSLNALNEANITEISNLSTIKLTTATKAIYRLVDEDIVTNKFDDIFNNLKHTPKLHLHELNQYLI